MAFRLGILGNDLRALQSTLLGDVGLPSGNVIAMTSDRPLTDPLRATSVNVLVKLDEFAKKVSEDDTFIFYFSGHGLSRSDSDKTDEQYLLTVDARSEALENTSVSLRSLERQMSSIRAKQIIYIIDACRNDPYNGKADNVRTPQLSKGLEFVAGEARARAGARGVAIYYACQVGERAYPYDKKPQSAFTYFLVEGLRDRVKQNAGNLVMNGIARKSTTGWRIGVRKLGVSKLRLGLRLGLPRRRASTPAHVI
jgi:uncharacterized caspase-like protein